ncbi:hypothetical protein CK203_116471 [Vitis vinifera]|uniref:Retrotransposon gag domain-containing protein n=1 Tax=Vitis vinifera TaxID=29760 RepID=A0A438BNY7_VITVI|nr:hypothetical protein CK203_116471 [Vitis vinifera]
MQGSACVEVMTTLHGRTPSLLEACRGLRTTERIDSYQSLDSSVEMLYELASTLAPIQEFMAGAGSFTWDYMAFHSIYQIIDETDQITGWRFDLDDRDDIPEASLPAKFRMPDIERYSGIGCPKIHLRLYNTVMRAHGIDDAQLVALFPMSLSGAAQRWFTSVEPSRLRTWEDMAHEFLTQFAFNADIDVSRRVYFFLCHLLEGKSGWILRVWFMRLLVLRRPLLEDYEQILLLPLTVRERSRLDHLVDLERLVVLAISTRGLRITYLIGLLQLELISLIRSISIKRFIFKSLTLLRLAYNHDHHIQGDTGLIVPLAPRPLPHPIPPHFRSHEHCLYHQIQGHDTKRCSTLHYAIYDLIDLRLVDLARPSVTTNPLPTHSTHAVPPPPGL